MKKMMTIGAVIAVLVTASHCNLGVQLQNAPKKSSAISSVQTVTSNGNDNIPAYYEAAIHVINFTEFSPLSEATLIAHDDGFNFIYQSNKGLSNNQPFISVIDAIPCSGFDPIWRKVQIDFNAGFTPRQLFSHDEIIAAASGPSPEISLTMTNEVYQCLTNH